MSGPRTRIDGVDYLYFGGTSYLGLQARPEVIEAGCAALRAFGVHAGTSRAGFGTTPPLLEVEARAAAFFGTEDAFTFGSGYVANHVVVAAVADEVDRILVDDGAHFCVLEASRVAGKPVSTFRHRDPADLERAVAAPGRVLVLADAVGPSSGLRAPVGEYLEVLSRRDESILALDDAHGFGVLGPRGRGLLDEGGLWEHANGGPPAHGVRIVAAGTLAKALGGFGGILPGTRTFVERARRASHYFDGASPTPAAVAGSAARALEIAIAEPGLRERVRAHARRLREGLQALGFEVPDGLTANVGVVAGDAARMRTIHDSLRRRGILVPYIPAYSGIPASGVLRFAVFATHQPEEIERLLEELAAIA